MEYCQRALKSNGALRGYVMVCLAAMGWGLWPYFLRHAEAEGPIDPASESVFPLAVMSLVTLPFSFRTRLPRALGPWLLMAWLGVSDAGNVLCFFGAYQKTSVAVAVLTHYLTPLLVALASPLVLREAFEKRTLGAAAVAFSGLFVLLAPWRTSVQHADILGALLGSASALFYASNVFTNKYLGKWFSPAQVLCFHGAVAIPIAYLRVPAHAPALGANAIVWLLAGSLLLGAVAGLLFLRGLALIRASHASLLTLLEPVVAVLLAAWLFGQKLGLNTVVGGLLVLGGAASVMLRAKASAPSATDVP